MSRPMPRHVEQWSISGIEVPDILQLFPKIMRFVIFFAGAARFQTRLGNCRIYTIVCPSHPSELWAIVKSVLISRSVHYDYGILAGKPRIFTMAWEFSMLAFIAGNQSLQSLALSTVPRRQYVAKSFASSPVLS
jgi:hypothetical protein